MTWHENIVHEIVGYQLIGEKGNPRREEPILLSKKFTKTFCIFKRIIVYVKVYFGHL